MGKGAGGCDDRPALSFGGGTTATADMPIEYKTAFDRIRVHRERYPLNDTLPMGSPCLPGADSDRVRFRRMVKQLEGMGYVVSSWEKEVDEADIYFDDGLGKGHYTTDGTLQSYSDLVITVKPLVDEITEDSYGNDGEIDDTVLHPNTTVINDVQAAMLEHGFYAVVNLQHQIKVTGMVAHPSRDDDWGYDQDAPHPMEVLRVETGRYYRADGTEAEQEIAGDDAMFSRYAAFYQSDELGYDQLYWARLPYGLQEAQEWRESGIDVGDAPHWEKAGFSAAEAGDWTESGIASSGYKRAQEYVKAGVDVDTCLALEAMELSIGQQSTYTPEQWKLINKAVKTVFTRGADVDQLKYNLYCLKHEYKRWKQDPSITDTQAEAGFKKILAWSGAGFAVYKKRYSWEAPYHYDHMHPWKGWEGCSPTQAALFRDAGFDRPTEGLTSARAKQVIGWEEEYQQLRDDQWGDALNATNILELCECNVTPTAFAEMTGKIEREVLARAALVNGLTIGDVDEWKPFLSLQNSPEQYQAAGLFKQAGTTVKQAIICHHAHVSPEQFLAVQEALNVG